MMRTSSCVLIPAFTLLATASCSSIGSEEDIQQLHQDIWANDINGGDGDPLLLASFATTDHLTTGIPGAVVRVLTSAGSCSGTLVAANRVITAAHCIACPGERATIAFGEDAHQPGARTETGDAICSPFAGTENDNWSGETDNASELVGTNDIAAIILDNPVPSSVVSFFPPVYMGPPHKFGLPTFVKTPLNDENIDFSTISFIHGHGKPCDSENCQGDGVRRMVGVFAYLRTDPCGGLDFRCSDTPLWYLPERFGTGSSNGDSGGPLVESHPQFGNAEAVIGVSSFDRAPGVGQDASVYAPIATTSAAAKFVSEVVLGRGPVAPIGDIGLYATSTLEVNDRAEVDSALGATADIAGGQVRVGSDAVVEGHVFASGTTRLSERTQIVGDVRSWDINFQSANWTIGGDFVYEYSSLPPIDFFKQCMDQVTFAGGDDIALEPPNHHSFTEFEVTIPPGHYGDVTVKRDRILSLAGPGDYFFESLNLDADSQLNAFGDSVRVYVQGSIMIKGVAGGNTNQLFIGTGSSSSIFVEDNFTATIVAPDAAISLSPGITYFGGLYGRDVTVHQDARFFHIPFNGVWCP